MQIDMNYFLWHISYCSIFEIIHVREYKIQLQRSTILVSKFAWSERVMEERTSRTRARSLDSLMTTPSGSTRFHKIIGAGMNTFQAQHILIRQKAKMRCLGKSEKVLLTQIYNFPGTPEEALSWTSSQILWEIRGLRILAKWTTVLHLSPSSSFFLSSSPPSSRTSPQQSPSFKAPAVEKLDEKNSLIGSTTRSLQRYQPHQGNSFLPPFFSFLSVPPTSNLWSTCDQSIYVRHKAQQMSTKWPSSTTYQCSLLEAINNNNMIFMVSSRAVFLMEVGYRGQHGPRQRLQSED